jgi:hypothetical protein
MEIIIALVVFCGILWFYFSRDGKKETVSTHDKIEEPANTSAPYKVPEPAATTPIPMVVELAPAGTEASIATPAKAPAKPKLQLKLKHRLSQKWRLRHQQKPKHLQKQQSQKLQ